MITSSGPSETEQVKYAEGSFNSPRWLFWLLLLNSRIISSFQEKFQHSFLRHRGLINAWVMELKGKGWVLLREPNKGGRIASQQEPAEVHQRSLPSEPFRPRRQGLFTGSAVER